LYDDSHVKSYVDEFEIDFNNHLLSKK